MKRISTISFLLFAVLFVQCNFEKADEKRKNTLLPETMRVAYVVNLQDSLFPKNCKNLTEKSFIDIIVDKVLANEVDVYQSFDVGNYYPYSINKSEKTGLDEINKKMDALDRMVRVVDAETGDTIQQLIKGKFSREEIKSVLFVEDWFMYEEPLSFKKDVKAVVPIRNYFSYFDSLHENPMKRKLFRIIPEKNQEKTTREKAQKRLKPVKEMMYEFVFNFSETTLLQSEPELYALLKENGEILEDHFAPYFNSLAQRKMIYSLIEKAVCGKIPVYDADEMTEKLPIEEIIRRIGIENSDDVRNPKNGKLLLDELFSSIGYDEYRSVIFTEQWLIDEETLLVEKKIKSIIPVRHYKIFDENDSIIFAKRKLFAVKL